MKLASPEVQMSAEENKALFRRWFEDVVNANNYAVVDELLAPGYVAHFPGAPRVDRGGHQGMVELFAAAFPDWEESIQDVIAEGDRVVLRVTAGGTHEGEFQGIAPTGKTVTITGMGIARIEDGKIAESWWEFDALGLMQQLGAIPAPAA
jgi:predicted ester cyclase